MRISRHPERTQRKPSRQPLGRVALTSALTLAAGLLLVWAWRGWSSASAQAALETLWSLCAGAGVG